MAADGMPSGMCPSDNHSVTIPNVLNHTNNLLYPHNKTSVLITYRTIQSVVALC
jgi:hypothetical protein